MNSVAVTFDMSAYDIPLAAFAFGLDFYTDSTFGEMLTEDDMEAGIFVGNTLHAAVNSHVLIEDVTFTIEVCNADFISMFFLQTMLRSISTPSFGIKQNRGKLEHRIYP